MSELKRLLVAAKHALEYFDNHSASFANSMTANELRQAIEAVEQSGAVDVGTQLLAELSAKSEVNFPTPRLSWWVVGRVCRLRSPLGRLLQSRPNRCKIKPDLRTARPR